jgi:hypothetical protein
MNNQRIGGRVGCVADHRHGRRLVGRFVALVTLSGSPMSNG